MRTMHIFTSAMLVWSATGTVIASDIRHSNWGDSIQKVIESEPQLSFQRFSGEDPDKVSITSTEKDEIGHEKATVTFSFYKNRLISVIYSIDISTTDNPFEHDGALRSALEEKYGETTVEVTGLKTKGWDISEYCSRSSEWHLPSHTISLLAVSAPRNNGTDKFVYLSYSSKEDEELKKREEEEDKRKYEEKRKAAGKKL